MLKIEKYELVNEEYDHNFNAKIAKLIEQGYQPFGKLKIFTDKFGYPRFAQVMVKYKELR